MAKWRALSAGVALSMSFKDNASASPSPSASSKRPAKKKNAPYHCQVRVLSSILFISLSLGNNVLQRESFFHAGHIQKRGLRNQS